MNESNLTTRERRTGVLVLVLILGLGVVLRLIRLDVSFWIDELLTRRGADQDLARVLTWRSYPLNYVQAYAALKLGDGEAVFRLPSVVWGVATIGLLYAFAASLLGRRVGLLAALLLAVSPCHVWLSQDGRYYALYVLAGTAMMWFGTRFAVEGRARDGLLFALACVVGMLDHPFFVVFVGSTGAGVLVWLLFSRRSDSWGLKLRRAGGVAAGATAGVAAFLVMCLVAQSAPNAVVRDFVDGGEGAAGGESAVATELAQDASEDTGGQPGRAAPQWRLGIGEYAGYFREIYFPARGTGTAIFVGVAGVWGLVRLFRSRTPMGWIALLSLAGAPIPFLLFPTKHFFSFRYFSVQLTVCVLLCAAGIEGMAGFLSGERGRAWWGAVKGVLGNSMQPKRRRWVLGVVGLGGLLFSTTQTYLGWVLSVLAHVEGFPEPDGLSPVLLMLLGPISLLLVVVAGWVVLGVGLNVAARGGLGGVGTRAGAARTWVTVVVLALLVPATVGGLAAYYERPGWKIRDWKGLTRYMAATLTPDDAIVLFAGSRFPRQMMLPIAYYLERQVENGAAVVPRLRTYYAAEPNVDVVAEAVERHPDSTVWVVNRFEGQWTQNLEALDSFTGGGRAFGATVLRRVGDGPVSGDGTEGDDTGGRAELAGVGGGKLVFDEESCLAVESEEPGYHSVSVGIDAPPLGVGDEGTLSMVVRYNTDILRFPGDIQNKQDAAMGGRIVLTGADGRGEGFEVELLKLRGKRDWHRLAFGIRPGEDVPEGARDLEVQVGVFGGTGVVWVVDVRFE